MKARLRLETYYQSILTEVTIGDTFDDLHKYLEDILGTDIDKDSIVILEQLYPHPMGSIVIVKNMGWICGIDTMPIDYCSNNESKITS